MQDILINIGAGERRVAILRSKKLEWYFVEKVSEQRIVGNVYKGKVSAVLNGMGAAFIECGLEKNGFLYIDDIVAPKTDGIDSDEVDSDQKNKRPDSNQKITDILKKNQDIMVQVTKEEIGTKGARLTSHISLPGRYLVLMPFSKRIGVSRKIRDDDERKRIKSVLHEIKLPKDMGLVARTAAVGGTKRDFIRDVRYLLSIYNSINRLEKKEKAPKLIFEEHDIALKIMRDFVNDETSNVYVDDKHEFNRIRSFTNKITPQYKNKIKLYTDITPLFEKHDIEKEIAKLFERKIYLKCGGYITIEQTEGMIAIDVNSGRFTGKKNLEDTIFRVNQESAEEIARQLRLRDIGGIVIIDFIDMEVKAHRDKIFSLLNQALRKDKARTNIISFSELNVVELTRQRVRKSLESSSYENCPYCHGKGMVKSDEAMVTSALRKVKEFLKTNKAKRMTVEVIAHPRIAKRLVNEDAKAIDKLKKAFRRRISITSNDEFHVEDIEIKATR